MNLDTSRPPRALVISTEVLLGVLSLVGLGAIVLLPGVSASVADSLPEYANLRGPLLALAIGFTALGLVALAMVVLLVQRIYGETVLEQRSVMWVDVLVGTLGVAAALSSWDL